ncbi:tetratricopeptide repeat protein [Christiangramia aquimixticola]|uniref:tetratricopeptide repeat protein n=1 Tax=Christiangramia aquimixticola TaxID=1697558 RepID=UPI003AA7B898
MLTNLKPLLGFFYLLTVVCFGQSEIRRAEILLNEGEINEAEKIFLKYENHKSAIEYLGDIASFRKNWDQAINHYQNLVKQEPDNAMNNFKLGGAMGMKAYYGSKFQAALLIGDIKDYLKKAAEIDPNHAEARRALVELYMQIPGFLGGSQTIAESYASDLKNINRIDALLADAYIYKINDYKELAKMKYEEALRLAIEKPDLITRNYLRYELGEVSANYEIHMEQGKKFLLQYIKSYGYKDIKTPAWAYLRLAQIERQLNNKEIALKHITKSLQIDPGFDKALIEKQKIQRL